MFGDYKVTFCSAAKYKVIVAVICITESQCFCTAIYKKLQTDQNEVSHSIGFCNISGSVKQTTLARFSHMTDYQWNVWVCNHICNLGNRWIHIILCIHVC